MLLVISEGTKMKHEVTIDVGRDFSTTPGGRYRSDGAYSGEEFREKLLVPALERGDSVIVDLDGPVGFTTSFLEEVFGGIVRRYGPLIKKRVRIRAIAKPTRAQKAQMYLERAIVAHR